MSTARPFDSEAEAGIVTVDELAAIIGTELAEAERIRTVAVLMVEKYAPGAPNELKNEAVVRLSGYMAATESSGYGAFRSVDVGGVSLGTQHVHGPMLRNSGAAALLSPWKVRRAGTF